MLVSEHLAWSVAGGVYHNDLLPLPYTEESARRGLRPMCSACRTRLGRRVLIENPSTYLRFADSAIPEEEFLLAVAARTGCGLLLDVNNIHVTATNHGLDAAAYVERLAGAPVGEIHLAGHHVDRGRRRHDPDRRPRLGGRRSGLGALRAAPLRLFPQAPALVEWDTNIPALDVLVAEAHRADAIRERTTMPSLRELQRDVLGSGARRRGWAGRRAGACRTGCRPTQRLQVYRTMSASACARPWPRPSRSCCAWSATAISPRSRGTSCWRIRPAVPCSRNTAPASRLPRIGAERADLSGRCRAARMGAQPHLSRTRCALLSPGISPGSRPTPMRALRLAPLASTALLASAHPIQAIWRANQPDRDGTIDATDGETVLVWRTADGDACRALSNGEAGFLGALLAGLTLGEAAGDRASPPTRPSTSHHRHRHPAGADKPRPREHAMIPAISQHLYPARALPPASAIELALRIGVGMVFCKSP